MHKNYVENYIKSKVKSSFAQFIFNGQIRYKVIDFKQMMSRKKI